jgi:transketolase
MSSQDSGAGFDCRQAFADELALMAQADARIVAVCNESVGSSHLGAFRQAFPERLINVGIAEQNMVGVAAGLANAGLRPFVCAASPFLTGRALEQIKADVVYADFPVVLCGMSPGVAYGQLGPTHHSIEDLAWTRAIGNLAVIVPADPWETRSAMRWALKSGRPCFMRIGRTKVPAVMPQDHCFELGRATVLRAGSDVSLVAIGTMVAPCLEAADQLAGQGISTRVINAASVYPLDEQVILDAARGTRGIVTVEEAMVRGGLGSAVAEIVSQRQLVPMCIMGMTDFAPTGDSRAIFEFFGLTPEGIAESARRLLRAH